MSGKLAGVRGERKLRSVRTEALFERNKGSVRVEQKLCSSETKALFEWNKSSV